MSVVIDLRARRLAAAEDEAACAMMRVAIRSYRRALEMGDERGELRALAAIDQAFTALRHRVRVTT